MSPVPVGYWHMEAGKLVLSFENPTDQEFEEKPELALGVLVCAMWKRCFEINRSGEGAEPPDGFFKILWEWVYCDQPLARKDGLELALKQDNQWDMDLALLRIRKSGRPIKSRQTAIKALFRKVYLNKSWEEVTRSLCQCGQPHDKKSPDNKLTLQKCQGNIESEVRHLKKVLQKYDIAFPPARIKGSKSAYQAGESSQSKPQDLQKIPTLEESRGALRVTGEYAKQHAAITILLSGDSVPETEMTVVPLPMRVTHGTCLIRGSRGGYLCGSLIYGRNRLGREVSFRSGDSTGLIRRSNTSRVLIGGCKAPWSHKGRS